jgi:hypothetical protein
MNIFKQQLVKAQTVLVALGALICMLGCSLSLPEGAIGNSGRYNYSPSVIQIGNIRQFWWCGQGVNPNNTSQDTDAIYYESINVSTNATNGPVLVLAETPGAWDSVYTCNPKVIGGVFEDPLGDGQTYSYAMYYVATASQGGNNSIGVAFSKDGILWKKYPHPIIPSTVQNGYGVGQPAIYNADHKSAISMFYEDSYPTVHHVAATSTDGLHFHIQGTITSNGLDSDNPGALWGDMAYDSKTSEWYSVFNRPFRPPSTTGSIPEYGQYGIELYKIPQGALLTGSTPWQELSTLDTNSTGYESNFIAGFVRDSFGNINVGSYPTIQMYTSVSYPQPSWDASPADAGRSSKMNHWILTPLQWAIRVCTKSLRDGLAPMADSNWRSFSVIFMQVHPMGRTCLFMHVRAEKLTTLCRSISIARSNGPSVRMAMDILSWFPDSTWSHYTAAVRGMIISSARILNAKARRQTCCWGMLHLD